MKNIFKVVQQGKAFAVQSQKAESGEIMKCNIVLQEPGGKYEDQFVAVLFGETAKLEFKNGDLVFASLRFSTRDYNGTTYQDVLVTEIVKLK